MLPLELYPSDSAKKRGLIGAGMLFFLAYQAMTWSRADELPTLAWIFLGLGVAALVPVARSYVAPRPSFAADASGFSVMGKPKRGWDEFRSAQVRTIRYGIIPISKTVVVKVGKSILGGSIQIHPAQLSAPAAEMAAEIQRYADFMKVNGDMAVAAGTILQKAEEARIARPVARPASGHAGQAEATPLAVRSFKDRLKDGGPISSTPRLSERLFGRRKVI